MSRNDPVDVFRFIDIRGPNDCWPYTGNSWGGRATDRRPYFMANGRRTMVYRLVWELVKGQPIPPGMLVLHSCDQGAYPVGCSNPNHLRLGTTQENTKDMTDRQRHGLPHNVIRAIRTLIESGRTQQEISDLYGVSRETISAIATRRVYSHISNDGDRLDGDRSDDSK